MLPLFLEHLVPDAIAGLAKGIRLHNPRPGPWALTRRPPSADAHAHRALPAQRRDWPQPRSARAIRQATALGTPTPSNCNGRASARANPVAARLRSTSRDSSCATRLPSCADYILRLQDTKPESLEIMLRLLLVAFPLVVALPAALDRHEANAIQFEVQPTFQLEVRSPPESRPLLPAATRDQHTTAPPRTVKRHLHTHNTQAHASPCTRRGTRARARRSTPRSTSSPTSSSPRTPTHQTRRCARPC